MQADAHVEIAQALVAGLQFALEIGADAGHARLRTQLVGFGLQTPLQLRTPGVDHGVDVVDVEPRADDPPPFLEELHER